jgi:arsenate reductase (glutaredoxin)
MQTQCSTCAAPLQCGVAEKSCWCQSLPSLPPSAYAAEATCLCAACLQTQLDAGVVLYGIANCDTVKKARAWLNERGIAHAFWDYKKHGVPPSKLATWTAQLGWDRVVNQRGTTWRGLPPELRDSVVDAASAAALLQANPSAIKRPIVAWGNTYGAALTLGFDAAAWGELVKI